MKCYIEHHRSSFGFYLLSRAVICCAIVSLQLIQCCGYAGAGAGTGATHSHVYRSALFTIGGRWRWRRLTVDMDKPSRSVGRPDREQGSGQLTSDGRPPGQFKHRVAAGLFLLLSNSLVRYYTRNRRSPLRL